MRAIAIRPYIPPPRPVKGRVSPVAETSAVVFVIEVPATCVLVVEPFVVVVEPSVVEDDVELDVDDVVDPGWVVWVVELVVEELVVDELVVEELVVDKLVDEELDDDELLEDVSPVEEVVESGFVEDEEEPMLEEVDVFGLEQRITQLQPPWTLCSSSSPAVGFQCNSLVSDPALTTASRQYSPAGGLGTTYASSEPRSSFTQVQSLSPSSVEPHDSHHSIWLVSSVHGTELVCSASAAPLPTTRTRAIATAAAVMSASSGRARSILRVMPNPLHMLWDGPVSPLAPPDRGDRSCRPGFDASQLPCRRPKRPEANVQFELRS